MRRFRLWLARKLVGSQPFIANTTFADGSAHTGTGNLSVWTVTGGRLVRRDAHEQEEAQQAVRKAGGEGEGREDRREEEQGEGRQGRPVEGG